MAAGKGISIRERTKFKKSNFAKWYESNSKNFLIFLIIIGAILLIIQSKFASGGSYFTALNDTKIIWFFAIPLIMLILLDNKSAYIILGGFYLALCAITLVTDYIPKPFATMFITTGLWLIVDYANLMRHNKSVLRAIIENYNWFLSVLFTGVILATLIELINAPAKLWWYFEPFPSLKIFHVTPLTFVIGWLPWVLNMIAVIFYFIGFNEVKR